MLIHKEKGRYILVYIFNKPNDCLAHIRDTSKRQNHGEGIQNNVSSANPCTVSACQPQLHDQELRTTP
jgi:hypothetical protein